MSNITKKDNLLTHLNKLTLDRAAFGIQTVDKAGKTIKEYLTDPKTNLIKIPTNIGSDNNNDDNHGVIPDSGVNIDPGSNLTNMEQLWSGTTDPNTTSEVVLSKDIANIGDGLQIKLNVFKKAVTDGQTADEQQSLTPIASNETNGQSGKYVLSVPYPVSILSKNLVVGKTINITLDGVGEALGITKVSQAMTMSILIKDSRTLAITCHQGYALDKTTSGNNGAFYTFQATYINSFTIAPQVEQMVNGTELFTGATSSGEVKLKNVLAGFSNVGDGIAVYFNKEFKTQQAEGDSYEEHSVPFTEAFDITNPLIIKKADLIAGNTIPIKFKLKVGDDLGGVSVTKIEKDNSFITVNQNSLTLTNNSILYDYASHQNWPSSLEILKIESVKNLTGNQ